MDDFEWQDGLRDRLAVAFDTYQYRAFGDEIMNILNTP